MRILFVVDHKYRDLPSNALIGYFLRKQRHEVIYISIPDLAGRATQLLRPEIVIVPKTIFNPKAMMMFRKMGSHILVVLSEGNPQQQNIKVTTQGKARLQEKTFPPHFVFFWSINEEKKYATNFQKKGIKFKTLGCPRLDFLHSNLAALRQNRKKLLKAVNLDGQKKRLLWRLKRS